MKRNLLNFTRGSQLLGHFIYMFAAGLKGPVIIAAIVTLGLCWWNVASALDDHQLYLVWMHLYASLYAFMEFDPVKLVNLKLATGGDAQLPMSVIREFPPMREAVGAFWNTASFACILSASILTPIFIFFYWFAEHFGGKSKERKHERGAMLVSLLELENEIERHNRLEQGREMRAELGVKWRLAGRAALEQAGYYVPSHLAGLSYPWRLEQSHAMIIGTTGTGKTVALFDLVSEARGRGQRAVIFDLTGAFIETFYDDSRDIILNPLDERCPAWSVFNDCASEGEFHAAAEALVPQDGGGSEQFWVLAARMLFVEMCLHLRAKGETTNEALATKLMTADLAQVHKLMRGTMADPLTAPEAARMAESIRAVFNANAKALKLLPTDGPAFSLRDWVRGNCKAGSILFISARYVEMSISSQLLTLWMDTAMNTLMTMERTKDLRLWFLIDELGALHRLPALEKGLQTARNFGGAIITGVHAFAKLKEVYGENMAMTLSSLARTKLILGTADRETAAWCSDFIGHRQVKDMEEGYSYGYNNARDAVSLTPRRQVEPLLLPDQFMNLPSLSGYIKFPDGFPAAPVALSPRNWPRIAEGFITREAVKANKDVLDRGSVEKLQTAGGTSESNAHPSANDDGAGKPVELRQMDLLSDLKKNDDDPEKSRDTETRGNSKEMLKRSISAHAEPQAINPSSKPTGTHAALPLISFVTGDDQAAQEAVNEGQVQNGEGQVSRLASRSHKPENSEPTNRVKTRPPPERDLLEGAVDPGQEPELGDWEPDM
ncbi:type IV secretion system DNA-binding domain-containing protein [Parasphingorhabdus sp. JC815]|uniref:type IV secretion system DNA-binding domain-containing protein n=1 Tax=Parasphingorhabdus sp. JC815 TaxID=3232140 RepID=UPI003457E21C